MCLSKFPRIVDKYFKMVEQFVIKVGINVIHFKYIHFEWFFLKSLLIKALYRLKWRSITIILLNIYIQKHVLKKCVALIK